MNKGGLQDGHSRALLRYLVPDPESKRSLANHIRLVDKYLCLPQQDGYTTYMDCICQSILKNGESINVEYMQSNLLVLASREKAFKLPDRYQSDSTTYDYVFDFSGETDLNLEEEVHIERTFKLLPELARLASNLGVKAYVRECPTLYHNQESKKPLKDGEGKPFSTRSKWVHEGIRAMASFKELNLVIARPALLYGPYATDGFAPRLLIGEIYKYIGETMEHLWSSELRLHTVHVKDFASALWNLANWISSSGGRSRLEPASSCLIPTFLNSNELSSYQKILPPKDLTVRAPIFNIVDDGDTTQGVLASLAEEVVGVKVGFYGKLINQFAKLHIMDVVEDVNEKHFEPWPEMLAKSNPPVTNTPFSPTLPEALLSKNHLAFENSKVKETLRGVWSLEYPRINGEIVRDQIQRFKDEGVWPNVVPRTKSK
ncbi:hypothetical protein BY996DRAFT_6430639 [Phakopsora pachyrhizi]|uniref:NAD-dependent epimerase/dehydratase domain-containing protein n=1 Tax=Phakopsora pachyrhizi TaxID=170000 RepID=A0AAV0B0F3_PHAPC|nr:hypothetical protein BY996DRAFT_6430639 [Phakopsora pachyrhizi]CAH7675173.1 hypothetical protein PPACK8108_LOCUS10144 [Phakopsora pachyrhizi]